MREIIKMVMVNGNGICIVDRSRYVEIIYIIINSLQLSQMAFILKDLHVSNTLNQSSFSFYEDY